jgi:putative ABC transport system permease protein
MTDLRDAFRALRATPVVTAVAVLSLALGIGANTAIFSIVNAVMLRALPVQEPQRLVQVLAGTTRTSWSNPLWEELRTREKQVFDGAFAYSTQRFNLAGGGEVQPANGIMASGGFFDVLGVPAILGRTFTRADDVRKGEGVERRQVAVISYGFWQRHYSGSADMLGKSVLLDLVPFTIIGVTGPDFPGIDQGSAYDVAIPLAAEPLMRGPNESSMDRRTNWWMRVIARLKPGQTIDTATAALRGVQPQMRQATLPLNDYRPQDLPRYLAEPFTLRPAANGTASLGRLYRQPLFVIMGVVALVLLIACANIANLLLARANGRRHELSVRVALGASRWRIARQLLTESLLLSAAGTVLGLVVAQWAARLLVFELSGESIARALDVGLDWRVMAFTVAVACATALLFGVVPALRATQVAPTDAMKQQGRSIVGEARFGVGSALVVAQVALSLVLVVGAALFMRTFSSLAHVRLGFEPDPLLIVSVNAKRSTVEPQERGALYERLRAAAAGVPGVHSAALQSITPLTNSSWDSLIENPEGMSLPESERSVYMNEVSAGFFATYGTPLVAGREFTAADGKSAPLVAVVNEAFVKKYIPNGSPIGRRFRNDPRPGSNPPYREIVGVVRDAVYDSLRTKIPPTAYVHALQSKEPGAGVTMAVRSAGGSPALLIRSVAAALTAVDGNVALTFKPYRDTVRAATAPERVVAMLSGFFGGLALLLAALGLYGVMSYAVSRRRTEIGIRMALGAAPSGAVRLVLTRVALLVGLGVAVGAGLSLWAARFVEATGLLFGLPPRDPMTLVTAALLLGAIGALAGYLPARRASRIDPARVLREG